MGALRVSLSRRPRLQDRSRLHPDHPCCQGGFRLKIAVIAGTRFDTALGCATLERAGILCHPLPMARTPEEQNLLQYRHAAELQERVEAAVAGVERRGFHGVMIFCNSLASCIDTVRIRRQTSLPLVTPLDVYEDLAGQWRRLFVIAANGHTLASMETLLVTRNAGMTITGFSSLALVTLIEREPAERVMDAFPFARLLTLAREQECQAVVLGCTHLTAVFPRIRRISPLPVIDTGTAMAEMITAMCKK